MALADECVMCGLCLPHCPTFALDRLESHSPRGRVSLVRALVERPDGVDLESWTEALESCLQCRRCETVCPAKVRYGELIEGGRALLAQRRPPRLRWRMLLPLLRRPRMLALLLAGLGTLALLLPEARGEGSLWRGLRWLRRARWPIPAAGAADAGTLLFGGCVARSFEAGAQAAMLRVAAAIGEPLRLIDGVCCSALPRHLGLREMGAELATRQRQCLASTPVRVLVLDSGCAAGLCEQLGRDAEVVEACRWLLERRSRWQPRLSSKPAIGRALRVGWFAPCTLRNGLADTSALAEIFAGIEGIDWIALGVGVGCCGAAGPQMLDHPQQAAALAAPLVAAARELNLDLLLTSNVGCALHLEERLRASGLDLPLRHPVECLAEWMGAN